MQDFRETRVHAHVGFGRQLAGLLQQASSMTTDAIENVQAAIAQAPTVVFHGDVKPDFGKGRYSNLMASVYDEALVIFRLSPKQAEKLARQVGSDFGACLANITVTARIGKTMSKDGKVTLSEAAKAKGVTATNALTAMRALAYAADAGKHGFKWSHTRWEVTQELSEYFAQL